MEPARAPIFIVGAGRSGTTLLRLMLCAHPRIYITHEASFYVLEQLYPRRAPRRSFLDHYFQTWAFRWLALDPARVLAGLPDPLPPERVGEAYAAVMREKAADHGRTRFGDKTPAHTGFLGRMFSDFPDARVVHIVRDPRGNALSLSRMPWGCPTPWGNATYLALQFRDVEKWRDRILRVRLEDLLDDRRRTLERVLDFVGEPWDDAVLDHAHHLPPGDALPPFPWLESAALAPSGPATRWQDLSPLEIRLVERVTRRMMAACGYAPAALAREPGRWALRGATLQQLPATLRHLGVWWRITRHLRDAANIDSERTHELVRELNPGSWALYPAFERFPIPPRPRARNALMAS